MTPPKAASLSMDLHLGRKLGQVEIRDILIVHPFSREPVIFVSIPPGRNPRFPGGIYRSSDGGETWSLSWQSKGTVQGLALSANAGKKVLWAGTIGQGVYVSQDEGLTWQEVNRGLDNWNIQCLAAPPTWNKEQWAFAGTFGGVYRTRDGGQSWEPTMVGKLSQGVQVLDISPNFLEDCFLVAGFYHGGGLYRSLNGGERWESITRGLEADPFITAVAISPEFQKDSTLYAGSGTGIVFRSQDGGCTWKALGQIQKNNAIYSLILSKGSTDRRLYAGTYSGVYHSSDGGYSWEVLNEGMGQQPVPCLRLAQGSCPQGVLVAGTDKGLYLSPDGGVHWEKA